MAFLIQSYLLISDCGYHIIFDFHHVNRRTLITQKQTKVKVLEDQKEKSLKGH